MDTSGELVLVKEEFELQYLSAQKAGRQKLFEHYAEKLVVNPAFDRKLISFQANKNEPFYRWFKYKEGFSSRFVSFILDTYGKSGHGQTVLDPFSGIGTTLTTALHKGYHAIGIELLEPGILSTQARLAATRVDVSAFRDAVKKVESLEFINAHVPEAYFFKHAVITKGAFPKDTEIAIACFNMLLETEEFSTDVKNLLRFAANAVLEDVSYTRKDGQYLRWDHRSGRALKSNFDKGKIFGFKERIVQQLHLMLSDISKREPLLNSNKYKLIKGSCLEELLNLDDASVDLVITSPPYCNRYDYTRTYALELAFNGADDQLVKKLRQKLLSATVENKSKYHEIKQSYNSVNRQEDFEQVVEVFEEHKALKEILANLNYHKGRLNNKNIPDMVRHYFFEMNFVVHELARLLKPGGKVVMVNDNVQYIGEEIPVDLILSDFAESSSLNTDVIWVLERGKGNSSQQMGEHGRNEMRKCVYIWSK